MVSSSRPSRACSSFWNLHKRVLTAADSFAESNHRIGSTWTHEDASEMMFDDLVRSNNIDIDEDDVNFIKDLIQGKSRLSAYKKSPEKKFLFDIVANKRNGIDVDK